MSTAGPGRGDEQELLERAQAGDEGAFGELVEPHRDELRAHCYRMLGSVHDAEDVVQNALLGAWRGLPSFAGRGSVRSWLYSITTHATLDLARHRSRRELPVDFSDGTVPGGGLFNQPVTDPVWLDSYPDQWLAGCADASPEVRYEQRESVELAFLVALQSLTPRQRAVLLLREVVGFSAVEIADQLDTTTASVNSALQRARGTMQRDLPGDSQQVALRRLGDERVRQLVTRYADAIEQADADTLISLLTEDAVWSMPPFPSWYQGHAAVRNWLVQSPLTMRWQHRPIRANGQVGVAGYRCDPQTGQYNGAVIDVLTLRDGKIAAVTAFLASCSLEPAQAARWVSGAELFGRFGLPSVLA